MELEFRGQECSSAPQVHSCAVCWAIRSFSEFVLRNPWHVPGPVPGIGYKAVSKSRLVVCSHGT